MLISYIPILFSLKKSTNIGYPVSALLLSL